MVPAPPGGPGRPARPGGGPAARRARRRRARTPAAKALALRIKQGRAQLLTSKFDVSVVAGCGPVACTRVGSSATVAIAGRTWRLKGAKATSPRTARCGCGSAARRRCAAPHAGPAPLAKRKLTVIVTVRVRAADGKVATQKVRVPAARHCPLAGI